MWNSVEFTISLRISLNAKRQVSIKYSKALRDFIKCKINWQLKKE